MRGGMWPVWISLCVGAFAYYVAGWHLLVASGVAIGCMLLFESWNL